MGVADQGHRIVPHTADLRVEAWAPTREQCLAEAVSGVVNSFAVTAGARVRRTAVQHIPAAPDEDLLVAAVNEVIYRLDADGDIPVKVAVRPAPDGGVDLSLSLADAGSVAIVGAVPKAASLHELRCAPDPAGQWSCSVIVDV
jgi:SHS2 domain-containing protein